MSPLPPPPSPFTPPLCSAQAKPIDQAGTELTDWQESARHDWLADWDKPRPHPRWYLENSLPEPVQDLESIGAWVG